MKSMICSGVSRQRQKFKYAVQRCQTDQIGRQVAVSQPAIFGACLARPLEQQAECDRMNFRDARKIDFEHLRAIHCRLARQQLLNIIKQQIAADQPLSIFLRNISHVVSSPS